MAHISTLAAAMFTDLALSTTPVPSTLAMEHFERMGLGGAVTNPMTMNGFNGFRSPDNAGQDASSYFTNAVANSLLVNTAANDAAQNDRNTAAGYFSQYTRIINIKEFPAIGTPANIVKVPEYGTKTSKQINAQADLNNMELTVNFVPDYWKDSALHKADGTNGNLGAGSGTNVPKVGDGKVYLFRFALLATDPDTTNTATTKYNNAYIDESTDALGTIPAATTTNSLGLIQNSIYYFLGKLEAVEVTPSLTDAITAKLTISIQSRISGAWTEG
jgi:hypothetical protein